MMATITGTHSVHHLISISDFEYVEAGLLVCRHCNGLFNCGLINVVHHIESCEEHPVFVQTGYDWNTRHAIGEEMTYGEYLKRKEFYKN